MGKVHQCFWITGLPGAGKSTFAQCFYETYSRKAGIQPIYLDGDQLRLVLGKDKSHFDRESRKELAFTYARLCQLLIEQGHIVICSTVSMFHEVHEWNRNNIPGYYECFIEVDKAVLKVRNQKSLYSSQNSQLPGMTQPVELPLNPDVRIVNDGTQKIPSMVDKFIKDRLTYL